MNEFNLQNCIFPNSKICDIKEMFFRSQAHYDQVAKILVCHNPTHIDFHSYFNLIPTKHFNDFFGVQHIDVFCNFNGAGEFTLYANEYGSSEPKLIAQKTVNSDDILNETPLFHYIDIKNIKGYIYLVIDTHSDTFELSNYSIKCLSDRNPASLGIVTCTFKREKEVLRTIDILRQELEDDKFSFSNTDIFIIDNDQKQNLSFETTKTFHHISNKNLGGAGGFTRGILESMDCQKDYVLLCDDDILAFGEVFRRAVVALSLMIDPKRGLHGCMLEEESKYTLHEVGEYFDINKRMHINPHYGKDVTNFSNLKTITHESVGTSRSSNMFGWWFTAFPISIFKEIGLPLPVFVSGDDLEYSLRAAEAGYSAYIVPNISIWHPSHMTQHAPLRNYFILRNRFAYYPIHTSEKQLEKLFKKTLNVTYRHLLSKRYATAESCIVALEDFLRGPEWFNEDLSNWTKKLKYISQEKTQSLYSDKWLVPTEHKHLTKADNSIKNSILSKLTFNGHLVPSYFHKKADEPASEYHICIPYGVNPQGNNITKMTLKSSSILYFDPRFSVGYKVQHNSMKFWILYTRLLKLKLVNRKEIQELYKKYNEAFKESTTEQWWKNRLDII